MSNLKTDDILGARPRIRHAPRNLIRDQKLSHQYPQSHNNPYNSSYPDHLPQYQYPYNNSSRYYQKPQPSYQLQPQTYNPYPLPQSQSQSQSHDYDYDYKRRDPRMEGVLESSPNVAGKSSVKIHSVNKTVDRYEDVKGNRPFMLYKEAPVVNYDGYQGRNSGNQQQQSTSYSRAFSGADKYLYQKYQQALSQSRQFPQPQPQPQSNQPSNSTQLPQKHSRTYSLPQTPRQSQQKPNPQNSQNSQNPQNNIQNPQNSPKNEQKSKNMFRGLGYNIISNSRYEYDMENRLKNSTSKWLE